MPSWVGDCVMATPALRALRDLYPQAFITALCRRSVKPIFAGMPLINRVISHRRKKSLWRLASRLRRGCFELAILLPNSFRTAFICRLAGIPRIVGYDRDARGLLLTDRLKPLREHGKLKPSPIVQAYLKLIEHLGPVRTPKTMQLWVTPVEERDANALLDRIAINEQTPRPWIVLNPGARYGDAKCWPAGHFAALADRLIDDGATVMISAAPDERAIVESILWQMKHMPYDLSNKGLTLGSLKQVIRRSDLLITNDTGPRHMAAAFGVPVVTMFGPTFPEWTEINFAHERQLSVKVPCGPCQLKKCPLDHRCLKLLSPDMVLTAARELLDTPLVKATE